MFTGAEIVATFAGLGITDVVWVPDSAMGQWEAALDASRELRLLRVCREGEAWPLAAGLYLGGRRPLVVMQSTGLFESGDALRNVLFDLALPLFALIGVRNALVPQSRDSARLFTEPIIQAWGLSYVWIREAIDKPLLVSHYRACQNAQRPGIALLAEGPQ